MPYAFTNYSAANPKGSVAFDQNIGLFIPANEVALAPTLMWSDIGTTSDASPNDAAGFPASRLFDEFPHRVTKPDSALTTWYVVMFWASPGVTIDSAMLMHQNLGTGLATDVAIQIADSADFLTAPITIATTGALAAPATGKLDERIGFYQLDHGVGVPQQYTAVQFLRLKITKGVGFTPILQQFIVGSRAQLLANPLVPFDAEGNRSSTSVFDSRGGAKRIYEFFRGEGAFTANFMMADADEFAPLDDTWSRSEQGTKHIVFAPRPKTLPAESFLTRIEPPEFFFPFNVSTRVRSGDWDFVEQGPAFVARER